MAWRYSDELKARTGNGWSDEPETETSKMAVIPTSQNGYVCNDRSLIETLTAPGTDIGFPVRKGPCGELLMWAAGRWHHEVEPLVPGTCWGFAERDIRGSTEISNHASGTAIDLNAPQHPLGTNPAANFTPAQIAAVRRIIADSDGALRWGGDYVGRKDGMHVEINAPEGHVAGVLAQVTGGDDVAPQTAQQIDEIHQQLLGVLPAWPGGITDDKNTPYNALQHLLRVSVSTNQATLMLAQLLKRAQAKPPGMLRSDVNEIAATIAQHPAIAALAADDMGTISFWKATAERLVCAFAVSMLSLLGAGVIDIVHVPWTTDLSISGGAAVASLLASLVASQVGDKGSPSFLKGNS
jgi:hypothetical protein